MFHAGGDIDQCQAWKICLNFTLNKKVLKGETQSCVLYRVFANKMLFCSNAALKYVINMFKKALIYVKILFYYCTCFVFTNVNVTKV